MKRIFRPYHLLSLSLVGSIVVLSLAKINKHSFYHHFFKSIAEIKSRNSQEWTDVVEYSHAIQEIKPEAETSENLNPPFFPGFSSYKNKLFSERFQFTPLAFHLPAREFTRTLPNPRAP